MAARKMLGTIYDPSRISTPPDFKAIDFVN